MSEFFELERNIKSDPASHLEDFLLQIHHLKSSLNLLKHSPSNPFPELAKLILFVANVSFYYKQHCVDISEELMKILEEHVLVLDSELRMRVVDALIRMRQAKIVQSSDLLPIFFKTFSLQDKILRKMAYEHIIGDLSNLFKKGSESVNMRSLQNYVSSMIRDANPTAARYATKILIRMYRKGIWNDSRTITFLTEACFSKDTRTVVNALQFFLGTSDEQEEKEKSKKEGNDINVEEAKHQLIMEFKRKHSKKTKKKKSRMERALSKVEKLKSDSRYETITDGNSIRVLDLLNDPQKFATRLFERLKSTPERFEVRVMMMDVVAKCIDIHKLTLLNFYPFMQKYLRPEQVYVPRLLVITATSIHELVPAEDVYPVIMTIANNFIHGKSPVNHITAGLNGIRAICSKQPLAMKKTLLRDLAKYKSSKDKNVQAAAKGVISLYRELDPKMLHKNDRGRLTKAEVEERELKEFGYKEVHHGIPGIDLLHKYKEGELEKGEVVQEEEDETQGDKFEKSKERQELITKLSSGQFLTQEDFRLLKILQFKQKVDKMLHNKKSSAEVNAAKKKLKAVRNNEEATIEEELEVLEEIESDIESSDSELNEDDIDPSGMQEEELEKIREKSKWEKRRREDISKTNTKKKKSKNAQMIMHSAGVKRKLTEGLFEKSKKRKKNEKKDIKWKLKGY